jgi:hypothetical protein
MTELIAFISGVMLTLAGALLSYRLQIRQEKKKEKERIRFEVYMNLMDLNSYYFWVTSAEFTGNKVDPNINKLIHDIALKTSDKLRQVDDIEYLDEILEILFSERFNSATERAHEMEDLLEKLHLIISPRFIKKIKVISKENLLLMPTKSWDRLNAPGSTKI